MLCCHADGGEGKGGDGRKGEEKKGRRRRGGEEGEGGKGKERVPYACPHTFSFSKRTLIKMEYMQIQYTKIILVDSEVCRY